MVDPEPAPPPPHEPAESGTAPDEDGGHGHPGEDPATVAEVKAATSDAPPAGSLRWWWLLAAGMVVALAFVATTHLLRATGAFGATLVLAAVVRAVVPGRAVGALAVRSRWLDVLLLLAAGVAVLVAGFTLNLAPLS